MKVILFAILAMSAMTMKTNSHYAHCMTSSAQYVPSHSYSQHPSSVHVYSDITLLEATTVTGVGFGCSADFDQESAPKLDIKYGKKLNLKKLPSQSSLEAVVEGVSDFNLNKLVINYLNAPFAIAVFLGETDDKLLTNFWVELEGFPLSGVAGDSQITGPFGFVPVVAQVRQKKGKDLKIKVQDFTLEVEYLRPLVEFLLETAIGATLDSTAWVTQNYNPVWAGKQITLAPKIDKNFPATNLFERRKAFINTHSGMPGGESRHRNGPPGMGLAWPRSDEKYLSETEWEVISLNDASQTQFMQSSGISGYFTLYELQAMEEGNKLFFAYFSGFCTPWKAPFNGDLNYFGDDRLPSRRYDYFEAIAGGLYNKDGALLEQFVESFTGSGPQDLQCAGATQQEVFGRRDLLAYTMKAVIASKFQAQEGTNSFEGFGFGLQVRPLVNVGFGVKDFRAEAPPSKTWKFTLGQLYGEEKLNKWLSERKRQKPVVVEVEYREIEGLDLDLTVTVSGICKDESISGVIEKTSVWTYTVADPVSSFQRKYATPAYIYREKPLESHNPSSPSSSNPRLALAQYMGDSGDSGDSEYGVPPNFCDKEEEADELAQLLLGSMLGGSGYQVIYSDSDFHVVSLWGSFELVADKKNPAPLKKPESELSLPEQEGCKVVLDLVDLEKADKNGELDSLKEYHLLGLGGSAAATEINDLLKRSNLKLTIADFKPVTSGKDQFVAKYVLNLDGIHANAQTSQAVYTVVEDSHHTQIIIKEVTADTTGFSVAEEKAMWMIKKLFFAFAKKDAKLLFGTRPGPGSDMSVPEDQYVLVCEFGELILEPFVLLEPEQFLSKESQYLTDDKVAEILAVRGRKKKAALEEAQKDGKKVLLAVQSYKNGNKKGQALTLTGVSAAGAVDAEALAIEDGDIFLWYNSASTVSDDQQDLILEIMFAKLFSDEEQRIRGSDEMKWVAYDHFARFKYSSAGGQQTIPRL